MKLIWIIKFEDKEEFNIHFELSLNEWMQLSFIVTKANEEMRIAQIVQIVETVW
jgi:hypothetical protein